MGNIPIPDTGTRITQGLPQPNASPDAFGAGVGRATQALGGAIGQGAREIGGSIARVATQRIEQDRAEQEANLTAGFDYSQRYVQNKANAPAGMEGFYEQTGTDYEDSVAAYTNNISDNAVRQKVKDNLIRRKNFYTSRAAVDAEASRNAESRLGADSALTTVQNRVRNDPADFDTALEDGNRIIDSRPGLTADQRNVMKRKYGEDLAKSRFDSLLESANTPEQLDEAERQLNDKKWQGMMSATGYDQTLDKIKTTRTAMESKFHAEITARIDNMSGRATDPTTLIPPEELAETEGMLKQYGTPAQINKFASIVSKQNVYRSEANLSAYQIRLNMRQQTGGDVKAVVDAVVGRTVHVESGNNPNAKNPDSSASGVGQFINSTWLATVKKHRPDIAAGKTDKQLLALKNDAKLGYEMTRAYMMDNASFLSNAGLPVTAGTLYLAHFAGPGGAKNILRAPDDTPLWQVMTPEALMANKFLAKQGITTAGAIKNWAERKMGGTSVDVGSYVRNSAREDILKAQKAAFAPSGDMMTYANNTGYTQITPLDGREAFEQRGREALSVADNFGIAREDATPLTADEVQQYTQTIKNGSSDDVLELLSNMKAMGPDMYKAAARQLGKSDPVFDHAAALAENPATAPVAAEVVRGYKRMKEDPSVKTMLGTNHENDTQFNTTVGNTLYGVDPRSRASVKSAADAYYIEHYGTAGDGLFDASNYDASVKAVMNGTLGTVNGKPTILPPGVDEDTMDTAIKRAEDVDWLHMSANGMPPMFRDGGLITADDIRDEGTFEFIGNGKYKIAMADGGYAITGVDTAGRIAPYIFSPDPDYLKSMAERPSGYSVEDYGGIGSFESVKKVLGITQRFGPWLEGKIGAAADALDEVEEAK